MTDTPAPVTAWAVVDKDGDLQSFEMYPSETEAKSHRDWYEDLFKYRAPHRVVRVEIKVVGEDK